MLKRVLQPKGISSTRISALAATTMLALSVAISGVAAASDRDEDRTFSFSVVHGATTTVLSNPDSDGHQLGDLRVVSRPTFSERGKEVGRLDAVLITTGIDDPNLDDEVRISNLIFVFGDGVDQIVVNGSGFYPATGGTLALDTTLTRPITGGSGAFAGASGWAVTQHFTDDTWKHTFHLIRPPGDDDDGERKRRGRRSRGRGR